MVSRKTCGDTHARARKVAHSRVGGRGGGIGGVRGERGGRGGARETGSRLCSRLQSDVVNSGLLVLRDVRAVHVHEDVSHHHHRHLVIGPARARDGEQLLIGRRGDDRGDGLEVLVHGLLHAVVQQLTVLVQHEVVRVAVQLLEREHRRVLVVDLVDRLAQRLPDLARLRRVHLAVWPKRLRTGARSARARHPHGTARCAGFRGRPSAGSGGEPGGEGARDAKGRTAHQSRVNVGSNSSKESAP